MFLLTWHAEAWSVNNCQYDDVTTRTWLQVLCEGNPLIHLYDIAMTYLFFWLDIFWMKSRAAYDIAVKLPWILPGAPLKINGAPGNIQGIIDNFVVIWDSMVPIGLHNSNEVCIDIGLAHLLYIVSSSQF